eukprot:gene20274-27032_t
MELHHKLRRDPSWHPNACNICGQLGHQAANCTSGTVNWRQLYGDGAFIMRGPQYFSEEIARKKAKEVDFEALEKRARGYAKAQCDAQGLSYDEMMAKAEELNNIDPKDLIKPMDPVTQGGDDAPLPQGWGSAKDPNSGRTYFYHKKTQKTIWERPTADTQP